MLGVFTTAGNTLNYRRMRVLRLLALLALAGVAWTQDPFASNQRVHVLIFARTDCPITNRYAPELQRIGVEFAGKGVDFWIVYPDPAETATGIENHMVQYKLPGKPIRDPKHEWVKKAEATTSPQAAIFNQACHLVYSGRIDDRYVAFGKSRSAPQTHDLEDAITATLHGKPVAQARTHAVGCYLADAR